MKSDHLLEVIAKHFCQQAGTPLTAVAFQRLGTEAAGPPDGLSLGKSFAELGLGNEDVLVARLRPGAAAAAAASPAKKARLEGQGGPAMADVALLHSGGSGASALKQEPAAAPAGEAAAGGAAGAAPAAAGAEAAGAAVAGIEKLAREHERLLAAKAALGQELWRLKDARSALNARAQAAAAARCDAAEELAKVGGKRGALRTVWLPFGAIMAPFSLHLCSVGPYALPGCSLKRSAVVQR